MAIRPALLFTGVAVAGGALTALPLGLPGTGPRPLGAQTPAPSATTGRIVGTVTERAARTPLAGVAVGVVGTQLGARTGPDGRFTLPNLAAGRYVLRTQLIGYAAQVDTVTVAAGQTVTVDFALRQVSVALQQVVVVGYGTQKRSDLTGAVTSVQPKSETQPIASLEQTLQGTAPGVQVTQATSAPGGGLSIRIRGGGSVNGSNEPLYVIDGFPVDNDANAASAGNGGRDGGAGLNPLAALNPNDIASIEILKDASATAIYGARGANGVVLITTKRGEGSRPRVSLDSYTGVQHVARKLDLLNATEFAQFANAWATNQNLVAPYADPASLGTGTDWQDLIFRSAPVTNLQLGVNGGAGSSNPTRYALSGGVFQQQGVVVNSDFRRLSLRGNLEQSIGSRIRLGSNVLVSRVNSTAVPTDGAAINASAGAVSAALQYVPILGVNRDDGTYTLMSQDFPEVLAKLGISPINAPNPVATALAVQDKLADTRVLSNVLGEFTLARGLTFRTTFGGDLSFRNRDTYYPRTTLQGFGQNGRALRATLDNTSVLNENTLSFNRTFGTAHAVNAVVGYTRQQLESVRENMTNSNFVSDITGYESIGAGSQAGGPNVASGHTRWTLASYLGRVNYTLLDRYLFSVTGRRDGSSRFGADNKWGVFPAAAFGWRVSEEPFFRHVRGVENLKLRASVGVAGNPSISPYQSLTRLGAQQYTFNGQIAPGYIPSGIGNAQLSWESTRQTDVGLDATVLGGRVDLVADQYTKRTDDLLLQIALPSEVGYTTAFVNAGTVENRGVELGVTLHLFEGDRKQGRFNWTTTVNYARNRNRVLSLGGLDRIFAANATASDLNAVSSVVQVGQPIGAFFGYRTGDLFRDSTTLNAWKAKTRFADNSVPGLGNRIYEDVNADGVIDANDRTILGDPTPRFTLGWQNTVSWKGFELSALLDGSYGNQILNLNLIRLGGANPSANVLRDRVVNAWSETNPNGTFQKLGAGLGQRTSDLTSELLEDGSYARLRTVTLSRAIPTGWFWRTAGGQPLSARAYVTGQNLYTWTRYSGYNPDVSSLGTGNLNRGVDSGAYPLARTVIFGLSFGY